LAMIGCSFRRCYRDWYILERMTTAPAGFCHDWMAAALIIALGMLPSRPLCFLELGIFRTIFCPRSFAGFFLDFAALDSALHSAAIGFIRRPITFSFVDLIKDLSVLLIVSWTVPCICGHVALLTLVTQRSNAIFE